VNSVRPFDLLGPDSLRRKVWVLLITDGQVIVRPRPLNIQKPRDLVSRIMHQVRDTGGRRVGLTDGHAVDGFRHLFMHIDQTFDAVKDILVFRMRMPGHELIRIERQFQHPKLVRFGDNLHVVDFELTLPRAKVGFFFGWGHIESLWLSRHPGEGRGQLFEKLIPACAGMTLVYLPMGPLNKVPAIRCASAGMTKVYLVHVL
jgi:hypothetical protein